MFSVFTATKDFMQAETSAEGPRLLLVQMDDNKSNLFIDFMRMFKFVAGEPDHFCITLKELNLPVVAGTQLGSDKPVAFYLGADQT